MSTEITIFDVPEQEVVLNKSQKQLEYEELEKATNVDKEHIWSMYEMEENTNAKQRPNSSLPSIMLKYVIQYCMPIVGTADSKYTISLQNEDRILAMSNNKIISIPADEQFKVIGIKIPSLFIKCYNKFSLVHYDYITDEALSLSGRYGLVDMQSMKYTQQRNSFTHPGLPSIGEDKVYFTADDHTLKTCSILIDYIDYIERYYRVNYPLLQYDLTEPTIFGTSDDNWRIINGRIYNVKEPAKKSNTLEVFVDFSKDLLKMFDDAQLSTFGSSFYYDIAYMLDANNLSKLYNIGLIEGTDAKYFKKTFDEFKKAMIVKKDYQRQVNQGYQTQLDIIKRKSIAFDKFGITEMSELSKPQRRIVDLEFSKLESTSGESGDQNRKLFHKLREVTLNKTPDELRETIKSIEKAIDKKDLDHDSLLPGGVCPHSYHYAKIQLEHFGRASAQSEIRNYLISRFALPFDPTGYFCKICGELIVEPDTTSTLKFSTDLNYQAVTPLQTMIWKEAMYIVSTNVRFTIPMPIKPLVNSLASGLKDIVAQEESKLYRSKTILSDTVKDTLSLYTAIYIYAALCALMIQNPGKLIFAREPPDEKKYKKSKPTIFADSDDEKPVKKDKSNSDKSDVDKSDSDKILAESDAEDDADADADDESNDKSKTTDKSKPATLPVTAAGTKVKRKKRLRYVRGGKFIADSKVAEKFYIMTALKLIFLSKESIISRLSNMSADVIKQIFIKQAYNWATKHAKPIQVNDNSDAQTSESPINTEMFYRYIYDIKKISTDKSKPSNLRDVVAILGRDEQQVIADVKNNIILYNTVVAPKKLWESKNPEYDDYVYRSFTKLLEYYQELIYTKSRMPRHVQVTEFYEKYADLLPLERKLLTETARARLRPNMEITLQNNIREKYNNFSPDKIDLAKHYCSTGELHKTGSYIYSDGKKEVEIEEKEIVEWLKTNNEEKLNAFKKMRVVDEKCKKCKVLIRSNKSLQNTNLVLVKAFAKIDSTLAFYQYYETRCPVDNLHDIENNVCKKCKFHTDHPKQLNKGYYEKYENTFLAVQRNNQSLAIKNLDAITKERVAEKPTNVKKVPEYQYSLKKTAEWSQLMDIKYNILINIGLFEQVKYIDIENATVNPSKTVEPNTTRAMRFKTHIFNFLRDYTLVLNNDVVVDRPRDLKEILDAQKKIDISNLQESLPHFDDFHMLNAKYAVLSIENYINFLQEYLATCIVSIIQDSKDKYKEMAKALAIHFTNAIVSREKFVSKPEPVFAKRSIAELEDNSDDELGVSGDEWDTRLRDGSDKSGTDVDETETYENDISHEGFDVENADDVWENE